MTKYHAKKTVVDGYTFASKSEARRYISLRIMEKGGVIEDLSLQPEFVLQEGFRYQGKAYRPIKYTADFKYKDLSTGQMVVEEVKSAGTRRARDYSIRKKLFLKRYGGEYDFREVDSKNV